MLGNLLHAIEELEANTPVRFRIIENTTHPTQFSAATLQKKPLTMQEQKHLQKLEDSLARKKSLGYMNVRSAKDTGCNAVLGRVTSVNGGRIQFNNDGSCPHKTSVHELMHSLGFYHEQSRADRDKYVGVNVAAVTKGKEHNFYSYLGRNNYLGHDLFDYDYASVMHYGEGAFLNSSSGFDKTIEIDDAKKAIFSQKHHFGNDFKVGSVTTLSKIDIQSLDATYAKCRNDVPFDSTNQMKSANNIANQIATVDESKSTYPGAVDSMYASSEGGSQALFDKDATKAAFPYEDSISGERSWMLIQSAVEYFQFLSLNIDSSGGNCIDSIVIRWKSSPNGNYTISYTVAGSSEAIVEHKFYHQSYVLQESLDYINFDQCTHLSKIEIATGLNSRTTRIAEIELLKDVNPQWVAYPYGPCVLKYDKEIGRMKRVRERSVRGL